MVAFNTKKHYSFDPEKHYLGSLCVRKHIYQETGKSLRYLSNQVCVFCRLSRVVKEEKAIHIAKNGFARCPYPKLNFDSNQHYLGKLCSRKHEFCEASLRGNNSSAKCRTGLSLRYVSDTSCVECRNENRYRRQKTHREEMSIYRRRYYQANKERVSQRSKLYYQANRDLVLQRNRRYRVSDKGKAYEQKYRQSPQGKTGARRAEHTRRAAELRVHNYPWTLDQLRTRFSDFDNACAYCGRASNDLALDHFLPISRGGANCLGNLVIACKSCNSSKNCKDPKVWFEATDFYSEKRWKRILAVLGLSKVDYRQMPLF